MVLVLFNNLTENDKSVAVEHLIKSSTPSQDFFLMIILSVLTATFGLLLNNVAVIIGSMLIAPMLYPFLSLSLGVTMSDAGLISRSFYTAALWAPPYRKRPTSMPKMTRAAPRTLLARKLETTTI